MQPGDFPVPYNYTVIGTCSKCGGPVGVAMVYMSTIKPTAQCLVCGAVPVTNYGPVIPMV